MRSGYTNCAGPQTPLFLMRSPVKRYCISRPRRFSLGVLFFNESSEALSYTLSRLRGANPQPQGPDGANRTLIQALEITIPSDDVQPTLLHACLP